MIMEDLKTLLPCLAMLVFSILASALIILAIMFKLAPVLMPFIILWQLVFIGYRLKKRKETRLINREEGRQTENNL